MSGRRLLEAMPANAHIALSRALGLSRNQHTGPCENVPAMLSEGSYVWAYGLCIGCLVLWAAIRRENSNMQELFLHAPLSTDLQFLR